MNSLTRLIIVIAILSTFVAACNPSGTGSAGPLTIDDPPSTATATTEPTSTSSRATTTTGTAPVTAPSTTTSVPSPTTTPPPPTDPDPAPITLEVFFLGADAASVGPVTRTYTGTQPATTAMQELLAGPSSSEATAGLVTAVPSETLLLGLAISDGVATVDLSGEFESGGGATAVLGRLAQVVYTLTQFPTVDEVQFLLDGKPVDVFSGEGVVLDGPVGRDQFLSAFPIGDGDGAGTPIWDQDDLPLVEMGAPDVYRVVLVSDGDSLNVRTGAGTEHAVMGSLLPGTAVRATGNGALVGDSTWLEVASPLGPGWVNEFYLTLTVSSSDGHQMRTMAEDLARQFESGAEFSDLIAEKGLFVAHHATPFRFPDVDGLLEDPTKYGWGSNALGDESPEIEPETFAEAVADPFASTTLDDDTQILVDEAIEGPNGRPVDHAIPTEFGGYPFLTIHDPGDDPQYDGLDWMTWYVSFEIIDTWQGERLHGGNPYRIIGLTIDEWAP